jgi:hypothetical protein
MSAAIIHLLNMSGPNPNVVMAIQACEYLVEAIRMLQEMVVPFPIVARYLKAIHGLATKWNEDLPANVRQALQTVDFPSPVSSNSNSAISPQQNPPTSNSTILPPDADITSSAIEGRKDSAPELLPMPQHLSDNLGSSTPGPQPFLWTPFPESLDGIPVDPPQLPTSNMVSTSPSNSLLEDLLDFCAESPFSQSSFTESPLKENFFEGKPRLTLAFIIIMIICLLRDFDV